MNNHATMLCGAHHIRIPVSDLEAAVQWFAETLGYHRGFPFQTDGAINGWALQHVNGGPSVALIQDPVRAKACSGFPLFAFGVPDEETVVRLAAHLDACGVPHGGVQTALVKVKLPFVQGPDGILFGFYVMDRGSPGGDRVQAGQAEG
jgi:catechol 2,3-dioxygenase-like lactoylglutathione lyase family enzyme